MSNDMKRIAEGLSKLEASNPTYDGDPTDAAKTLIRRHIMLYTAATNANASNAILANASLSQWRAPGNGRVVTAHFIAALAATAAGADNTTIAAVKLHANGFSNVSVASQTSNTSANGGTGNLVIGVPAALTVTDKANARFTRGTVIAPQVSMNGSGVAMGAGTLELVVELEQAWDEAS